MPRVRGMLINISQMDRTREGSYVKCGEGFADLWKFKLHLERCFILSAKKVERHFTKEPGGGWLYYKFWQEVAKMRKVQLVNSDCDQFI